MSAAPTARWLLLALAVGASAWLLARLGVPSATMFAAAACGIAVALRWPRRVRVGPLSARFAQAMIGVVLGSSVSGDTFPRLGDLWLPVTLITLVTLVGSVALGLLLWRASSLDAGTAVLSSMPGGAIGLVAMARELGTDDRLVAFNQYFRVLLILVATPLIAATAFTSVGQIGPLGPEAAQGPLGFATAIALGGIGWLAGRALRLPAASLLGPMFVTAAIAVLLPELAVTPPAVLRETAFALVGLDVGLRFTREVLAQARRLIPMLLLCNVLLLGGAFVLALGFAATTSVALLDSYLVTTPGGLPVVVATAYSSGADTGLVTSVQIVRMLVMLAAAPITVRLTLKALGTGGHGAQGRVDGEAKTGGALEESPHAPPARD